MGACTRAIETRGGRADARRNGRVHSCAWHMHIVRGGNRRRSQVPKKSVIGVRDERERERKKPQEKTSHELRRQRKGRNYMYYVYSDITYGRLRFIGGRLGSYMHVCDPKMKVLCVVSVISEHVCVNSAGSLV